MCPFALFTFPSWTTHVGSNQFQEIVSYKIVFFIKRKGYRRCLNININITNKTFTVMCLMKYFTRSFKIFLYWNRFVIDHRWVGSLWLPEGIHSRTMRDLPEEIFSSVCWKSWHKYDKYENCGNKYDLSPLANLFQQCLPVWTACFATWKWICQNTHKHIKYTLIIVQNL